MSSQRGTLTLAGVPIGHVEDITLRVLRLLREADLVVAEDARVARKLLAHYQIETPVLSLAPRQRVSLAEIEQRFRQGGRFVFVADVGMPWINDPGSSLVLAALRAGLEVTCAPGPSALLAALALSGFPSSSFLFAGSPPRSRTDRHLFFQQLRNTSTPIVVFDSARTLRSTLTTLCAVMGGTRPIAVFRALTRPEEWHFRGSLDSARIALDSVSPQGEFTLVIGSSE